MVSMTIFALGAASFMARAASMPLVFGMRMSIRTTSGSASRACATASAPSLACPTSSMSGSSLRTISSPRRKSAWSSAISTRIGSGAFPLSRAPVGAPDPSLTLPPPDGPAAYDRWPGYRPLRPAPGRSTWRSCHQTLTDPWRAAQIRHAVPGHAAGRRPSAAPPSHGPLHQPHHPVVVTAAAVHHAEQIAVAVVEQIEIVPDELHLQQGLVDRHGGRVVQLLPDHQGAVALHL